MSQTTFVEYRAKKIVNVHKHVDGPWFWDKYSAHPYVGCRSGCAFCYARGGAYAGRRDPEKFDSEIRVKVNAPARLAKELARLQPDVIACGDWQQPAEKRFGLSRAMLEVVRRLGFPLLVVERSPLVVRDLDLLQDINHRCWVSVLFSITGLDPDLKRAFEPRSPGVRQRLNAMAQLASAGIRVGTALMPVLPFVGDRREQIEDVVRATRDQGGQFVVAGGLTLQGAQAEHTLSAYRRLDANAAHQCEGLYFGRSNGKGTESRASARAAWLGNMVREACVRHQLRDRMPRYIAPGPQSVNKQLAEVLFLKTYELELARANAYRIWAYRKAAWTVDELEGDISELFSTGGERGLRQLPGIGPSLSREMAAWLRNRAGDTS